MKNENAALVKRACRICNAIVDAEIIMGTKFRPDGEPIQDLSEVHGKVVGYIEGHGKCGKCEDKTKNKITLVTIDLDKSEGNNIYLTGDIILIKSDSEFGKNLLDVHYDKILGDNILYIDKEVYNLLKEQTNDMQ